jgi:HAD superfamily hydrolase (TIGR01484 family)
VLRAAAVDLDGTLLRSDKTVSRRTIKILEEVTAAGVRVVIVTARPPRFVRDVAAEAGIGGPAVCSNGAIVLELDSGAIDMVDPLPIDLAERTARTIAAAWPEAAFAVETGHRALIGPGYGHVGRDTARIEVDDLWSTGEGCVKLLVWSAAPVTDPMVARLRAWVPEVSVSYSGAAGMIEISAAGATKERALARLCAGWGIAAGEVVAFGDMPNDLGVLGWAGLSVAVANAHPDVRAAADRITASNNDDGVADVLAELLS